MRRSTQLFNFLAPTLRFMTPAQSVCNYATLLFRNASDLLSLGDGIGTWQRFTVFGRPGEPNPPGVTREQREQPLLGPRQRPTQR